MKFTFSITTFLVLIAFLLVFFFMFKQCHDKNVQIAGLNNYINQKSDTITKEKVVRVGEDTTELASIRVKWIAAQLYIKSEDDEIKKLRTSIVKKNEQLESAVQLQTTTSDQVQLVHDTVPIPLLMNATKIIDDKGNHYYFNDKWTKIELTDSAEKKTIDYRIKNDFSIVTSYKKTGFLGLGAKQAFVHVNSLNPKSVTDSLQAYKIPPPPKKFYQTTVFKWTVGSVIGFLTAWKINEMNK